MDFIATYGLPAYWDLTKEKAKGFMQNSLTANQMLMRTIREIDCSFPSDKEFVRQVKSDLFNDNGFILGIRSIERIKSSISFRNGSFALKRLIPLCKTSI